MNAMLAAALDYAAAGRAVFPCKPNKAPYTAHGLRDASTDRAQIEVWWTRWPDALIGGPVPPGQVVLDVDPHNGGRLDDLDPLPVTRTVVSGRGDGGRHFYFRRPEGALSQPALAAAITTRTGRDRDHIGWDLRDAGKHYLILPPSPHPVTGKPYVYDNVETAPAEMPPWLIAVLRPPVSPVSPIDVFAAPSNGHAGPISEYNRGTRFADLLTPAGWTLVTGDGESDGSTWRHPTATASSSASVRGGRLYCYSTTPGLPLAGPHEGGMSPFDLLVQLHHRGDEGAAQAALRGSITGPPTAGAVPAIAEAPEVSSWARTDLGPILTGTALVEVPTLLVRADGHALLYPGRVSDLHGESESGKSWVAQAVAAVVLGGGGSVLFLDFESDAGAVVGRLRAMGCPQDAIGGRLDYRRPDRRPSEIEWAELLSSTYDFAVIDGVTDALGTWGKASKDNDEVASWLRLVAKPIARLTGAAVVLVDHVTKDSEGRGRFAIGAQAKLSGLDGASYVVEVIEPLGRGLRGVVGLRVAKDRPGNVRPFCGPWRKSDRTQEAARVVIDSTAADGSTVVTVRPWLGGDTDTPAASGFRPTALMEKASWAIEVEPGISAAAITKAVGSRKETVLLALSLLVAEKWVEEAPGPRNAKEHRNLRVYRQRDDPASDKYSPPSRDGGREQVVPSGDGLEGGLTCSGPYTGEPGTGQPGPFPPVPGTTGNRSGTGQIQPRSGAGVDISGDPPDPEIACARCGQQLLLQLPGRTICGQCEPTPITVIREDVAS